MSSARKIFLLFGNVGFRFFIANLQIHFSWLVVLFSHNKAKSHNTRMHSSRMRTGRSLTVCRSQLPGGVSALGEGVSAPGRVSAPGGCLLPGSGVSAPGGVCSRGVSAPRGCIPGCTEAENPPLWTESQTSVKTLPWPNFEAAGINILSSLFRDNRKYFVMVW